MSFIYPDHNAVSPYLIVSDARDLLNYLKIVFDAKEILLQEHEGKIFHASAKIYDSVVMLSTATDDWPPQPTHLHIYVPNVHETVQKALDNGAELVLHVKHDEGSNDHRGMVKGPQGNMWSISTHNL